MIEAAVNFFQEKKIENQYFFETWIKEFMKGHGPKGKRNFKIIKQKLIDRKRWATQNTRDVLQQFEEYTYLQKEHNILFYNIQNFDKTAF